MILWKHSRRKWAWPIAESFSSIQGIWGYKVVWMCYIRCGSYRQKRVGLGYSVPCRQIYVCSTTFSGRKIKIFTITIGFLAPLVLGNASYAYAFPRPLGLGPLKNLWRCSARNSDLSWPQPQLISTWGSRFQPQYVHMKICAWKTVISLVVLEWFWSYF